MKESGGKGDTTRFSSLTQELVNEEKDMETRNLFFL